IYTVHGQLQSILVTLCGVVILTVGGAAVAAGTMTLGQFLSFWVAAGLLNGYVTTIMSAIPEVIAGNESMVTLYRFAHAGEALPYWGRERIRFTGRIDLDGVEFGYKGVPVLRVVRLVIRHDSTQVLGGPNDTGMGLTC